MPATWRRTNSGRGSRAGLNRRERGARRSEENASGSVLSGLTLFSEPDGSVYIKNILFLFSGMALFYLFYLIFNQTFSEWNRAALFHFAPETNTTL
jgi:hypothetical protein